MSADEGMHISHTHTVPLTRMIHVNLKNNYPSPKKTYCLRCAADEAKPTLHCDRLLSHTFSYLVAHRESLKWLKC